MEAIIVDASSSLYTAYAKWRRDFSTPHPIDRWLGTLLGAGRGWSSTSKRDRRLTTSPSSWGWTSSRTRSSSNTGFPRTSAKESPKEAKTTKMRRSLHFLHLKGAQAANSVHCVNWLQVSKAVGKLDDREGLLKLGLLNFNITEVNYWQKLLPRSESFTVHLEYAKNNLTWKELYPEWIYEEDESEVPTCPDLPKPEAPIRSLFELIAVKLPSNRSTNKWSRDVARLHLQLSAAKLATAYGDDEHKVRVLFITDFFPVPNLFKGKDLVIREGDAWLYKPDLRILKEKLQLPVGSCQLSIPINAKERPLSDTGQDREV